jgi:hypothetical protein
MTLTLRDLADRAELVARAIIASGVEHEPVLLVLLPAGRLVVAGFVMPDSPAARDDLADALRRMLGSLGAVAYVLVLEGWSTTVASTAEVERIAAAGGVARAVPAAERAEVLTLTGESATGDFCVRTWRIERPQNRLIAMPAPTEVSGRFVGLLAASGTDA